jgi:putative cell wall-binding protein
VIGKKGLVILMSLIFILGAVPLPRAFAENTRLVILVSDNEADWAIAQNVADLLGAHLIVSPWGTYDPAVSAEILSVEPERVIIIGGPVAIPEEYTKDFDEFGIPYERWYGETRYETNLVVIRALGEEFPEAFDEIGTIVIANGRDALAIEGYLEAMKLRPYEFKGKPILILTDEWRENVTIAALERFVRISEVKYAATYSGREKPMFPLNREEIDAWIRNHFASYTEDTLAQSPTEGEVHSLLINVQNKTKRAEELLDGLRVPDARRKLEEAKNTLNMAWSAYNSGDYSRAYQLAMVASFNADFVISRAYREMRTVYQGLPNMQLQREIQQFEIMAKVLKRKGYDVSELESLISQAKEALKEGKYSLLLNELIPEIKETIAKLTTKRPSPGIPGGKNHKRP